MSAKGIICTMLAVLALLAVVVMLAAMKVSGDEEDE